MPPNPFSAANLTTSLNATSRNGAVKKPINTTATPCIVLRFLNCRQKFRARMAGGQRTKNRRLRQARMREVVDGGLALLLFAGNSQSTFHRCSYSHKSPIAVCHCFRHQPRPQFRAHLKNSLATSPCRLNRCEKAFSVSGWQIVSCGEAVFAQNLLPLGQSELQKLFCGLKVFCRFQDCQGFAVMTFCSGGMAMISTAGLTHG